MELSPAEQLEFDRLKNTIASEYAKFGFTPIDTPVLERAEVLLAKAGGDTEKQLYRFKKGDTDIAMRFDLTVPLARYVAEHYNDLVFPFRRSHIAKVYRGERPQKGREREFYQCDIDIIGHDSLDINYDAEIVQVIYSVICKLSLGKFKIKLNNRKILTGLISWLGNSNTVDILRVIDKVEKIPTSLFEKELGNFGLDQPQIDTIKQFITVKGDPEEVIAKLRSFGIDNEQFTDGIVELETVVRMTEELGVPKQNLTVDPSIARGLDYYTGTVYETFLVNHPELGSIASGGRYDNLADCYTKQKLPGVGASIGLTRLFSQIKEAGIIKFDKKNVADVVILPLSEKEIGEASKLAQKLRQNNIKTDIFLSDTPIKKKFRYADQIGIPYTVVVGADEVKNQKFTLQNMLTGDKKLITADEIIKILS